MARGGYTYLLVDSCYRNLVKLRPCGPSAAHVRLNLTYLSERESQIYGFFLMFFMLIINTMIPFISVFEGLQKRRNGPLFHLWIIS